MKVLLIGSGGREHSLAIKLSESPKLSQLYTAPGNAGTAQLGQNIPISDSNLDDLLAFAKQEAIDLTIVGPEAPLVLGIVDLFETHNLAIIGPSQKGAQLEGSKQWAKALMIKYKIPTAIYKKCESYDDALAYIKRKNTYPIVIKADGLAAGKGVTVASDQDMAEKALHDCFVDKKFADAGSVVVIEDFLTGEEASIFAFTDGETILPMTPAQDHKAIYDEDMGPNTGGMGAYSPAPIVTKSVEEQTYQDVFLPLLKAFKEEGITYKGIVYAGLMIDNDVPSIVEFNVRFGDPETQVVLPRLENDLLDVFIAISENRLSDITLSWKKKSSVCVVLAAGGYPEAYEKNLPITGTEEKIDDVHIVHAGTKEVEGQLLSNGGRVLGVVGCDESLTAAIKKAYQGVEKIHFKDNYCRSDIGQKALR